MFMGVDHTDVHAATNFTQRMRLFAHGRWHSASGRAVDNLLITGLSQIARSVFPFLIPRKKFVEVIDKPCLSCPILKNNTQETHETIMRGESSLKSLTTKVD